MSIVYILLGHDAWTTRQLLLRCRELSDEQPNRKFDFGDRSLLGAFEHVISCKESHTGLLLGRKAYETNRDDGTIDGMLKRLTIVAKDFSGFASKVEHEGRFNEMVTNPVNGNRRSLGGGDRTSHYTQHAPQS